MLACGAIFHCGCRDGNRLQLIITDLGEGEQGRKGGGAFLTRPVGKRPSLPCELHPIAKFGNNSVYCFLVIFFGSKSNFLEGMDIMNIVEIFEIYV